MIDNSKFNWNAFGFDVITHSTGATHHILWKHTCIGKICRHSENSMVPFIICLNSNGNHCLVSLVQPIFIDTMKATVKITIFLCNFNDATYIFREINLIKLTPMEKKKFPNCSWMRNAEMWMRQNEVAVTIWLMRNDSHVKRNWNIFSFIGIWGHTVEAFCVRFYFVANMPIFLD